MRRTPVQPRSRATVERILDAAAHVFAERGYAGTTNQVAERADISIGSLYQYFEDKAALLLALHQRHLDAIATDLVGANPDLVGDDWVRWLVSQLIDRNAEPDATVLWETSRVVPGMRARTSELIGALAVDAARALGIEDTQRALAVVVTALGLVHEIALPDRTETGCQIAVDGTLAVARTLTTRSGWEASALGAISPSRNGGGSAQEDQRGQRRKGGLQVTGTDRL